MPTERNPQGDAQAEPLGYRDELPLQWRPLETLPQGPAAERQDDSNTRLLTAATLLDEKPKLGDEPTLVELELLRIHHKLNLLLELAGSLLRQQQGRAQPVRLRLSWQGLSWQAGDAPPAVGDVGLVEVFLKDALQQPLRLPGRIEAVSEEEIHARFVGLSEACQAALERHVFQHHRRAVAETRQPPRRI